MTGNRSKIHFLDISDSLNNVLTYELVSVSFIEYIQQLVV